VHRAYICAALQQVRGKRMTKRMHRWRLRHACSAQRSRKRAAKRFRIRMMPPSLAAAWIDGERGLRKHPVPTPRLRSFRMLYRKRTRHFDAGHPSCAISLPQSVAQPKLLPQLIAQRTRQHHYAIFIAFALAFDDRLSIKIDVFRPQSQAFKNAHTRAVEQFRERCRFARHQRKRFRDLTHGPHFGQSPSRARATDLLQPRQFNAQYFLAEKKIAESACLCVDAETCRSLAR
jgi:hypothetical protein